LKFFSPNPNVLFIQRAIFLLNHIVDVNNKLFYFSSREAFETLSELFQEYKGNFRFVKLCLIIFNVHLALLAKAIANFLVKPHLVAIFIGSLSSLLFQFALNGFFLFDGRLKCIDQFLKGQREYIEREGRHRRAVLKHVEVQQLHPFLARRQREVHVLVFGIRRIMIKNRFDRAERCRAVAAGSWRSQA